MSSGERTETPQDPRFVDIVHAYPPGPDSSFVEVEDEDGRGMKLGDWVERQDGTWALRIYAGDIEAQMIPRRPTATADDDTCDYCEKPAHFYNSGDRTCDGVRCGNAAREGQPKKQRRESDPAQDPNPWTPDLAGAIGRAGFRVAGDLLGDATLWCKECGRDSGFHYERCSKSEQRKRESDRPDWRKEYDDVAEQLSCVASAARAFLKKWDAKEDLIPSVAVLRMALVETDCASLSAFRGRHSMCSMWPDEHTGRMMISKHGSECTSPNENDEPDKEY